VSLSAGCGGETAATEPPAVDEGDEAATAVSETILTAEATDESPVAATDVSGA